MATPRVLQHLFLLLSGLWLLSSFAQEPICVPLTDPTCSQFVPVGTPIFVPNVPGETDYASMTTYANRIINLLNFTPVLPLCYGNVVQLICLTWLRPCQQFPNGTAMPLPQEPCMDLCYNYYNICGILQAEAPGEEVGQGFFFPLPYNPPLNCSDPPLDSYIGNQSFYAQPKNNYTLDGVTYHDLPCSARAPVDNAAKVCVPPLQLVPDAAVGTICTFLCPLPSLSDAQYSNAKLMQGIMGWLSWSLTALLILSLLFNPTTRDFPRNLILMCAFAANVAAAAICLPTYAGYEETWCGGSDTTITPQLEDITFDRYGLPGLDFYVDSTTLAVSSSLCTFQGAMLQFGFLAAVFWWVVIAFNMCFELFFAKVIDLAVPKWKWLRFGIYNAIVWGLAFLCMVIPASAGYIKFVSGATYCFVTSEENNRWILSFWFIPVGLALFFGVIFFLIAIVRVTWLLISLKKLSTLVILYLRIFIFIFLFLFLFTVIFAYNIQVAANQSTINEGYSVYYQCLIYADPDCSLDNSVSNYNLVMLKGFAISSLGTFIFLIFFFSWDAFKFYYTLVRQVAKGIYHGNASEVWQAGRMLWSSRTTPSVSGSSLTVTGSTGDDETMDQIQREQEEESDSSSNDEPSSRGLSTDKGEEMDSMDEGDD